jgi:hypothetical protein
MECDHPDRKHQADTDRPWTLQPIEANAQADSNECGAEERNPEHVPWNPSRYWRRDEPQAMKWSTPNTMRDSASR